MASTPDPRRSFGSAMRGWLEDAVRDVRYAVRTFTSNAGFTLTVVLTLALGIGANTALFSIINTVLLRPLPYPDPDRIVVLWERDTRRGLSQELVAPGTFADWRAQNTVFESMGYSPAWPGGRTFLIQGKDGNERLTGAYASSGLFTALGVRPMLGRLFRPDEDSSKSAPVAMVSYRYWQRALGGTPDVLGRTLPVDKYDLKTYTIVGVLPPDFTYPGESDLWLAAGHMGVDIPPPGTASRGGPWLETVARLKPGVTVEQAQTEMTGIAGRLAQAYTGKTVNTEVTVRSLKDQLVGPTRTALLVLFGAVACVLLIACANVANLLLSRGAARQRELHIRAALGANRQRVLRQLLTESVALALIGAAVGIFFAYVCVGMAQALGGQIIPRLQDVRIDATVLLFTLGLALATGLLFGLAPSLQLWTSDLNETLKDAARGGSTGASHQRFKRGLVIAEVAIALVLLAGAGLLIQSLVRLRSVEPGFQTEHALAVSLDLSSTTYDQQGAADRRAIMRELLARVRGYPGVQAVGASSMIPLAEGGWDDRPGSGWSNQAFTIEHRDVNPDAPPNGDPRVVTPDFFRAMGIPLRAGRVFSDRDGKDDTPTIIINETLARRYWPGYPDRENPIGQRLVFGTGAEILRHQESRDPFWREVVGIVGDVRSAGLHAPPRPELYLPYDQVPWADVALVIRSSGDPEWLAQTTRQDVKRVSAAASVTRVQRLNEVIDASVAAPRFRTLLLTVFSFTALLLAAVGIYGTLAYAVTQRTREIGIRIALGAERSDVLWQIVREALVLTGAGIAAGFGVALLARQAIGSLLFGIDALDPLTLAGVAATLALVATMASLVPAFRATRVDPLIALRAD